MNDRTAEGYRLYFDTVDNPPLLPANLAPVGEAFALLKQIDTPFFRRLYDPDGSHPSVYGAPI